MKFKLTGLLFIMIVMGLLTGCGQVVPPGTTVILVEPDGSTKVIEQGAYKAWGRTRAYYVDGKIKSYAKNMKILCADEINMDVAVKWVGSFLVNEKTLETIKKKVPAKKQDIEGSTVLVLSLDQFFKTTMEDILSNITRDVISPYNTDNIRDQRQAIRAAIKEKWLARMSELKYPIATSDILITNLDYPPDIKKKREKIKQAELQDLENAAVAKANVAKAKRDAELATERGKAALVEAQADAAANKARSESLTPEILAVKQLEVLVKLAEGQNNTVVVIPFEAIRPGGMQDVLMNRESIQDLTRTIKSKK